MRILQINAVYEKFSTGRNTQELDIALTQKGYKSYVASTYIGDLQENAYTIGGKLDWKTHAALSRIVGKQGYFSKKATCGLLRHMDEIQPNVVILGNLHSNYINIPMLLKYLGDKEIPTVIVLHDSFFYTGKCVYYIEDNCYKWKDDCGHCPALKKGNPSLLFDRTSQMLKDKKKGFGGIKRLAVVGVSDWITRDASESILSTAKIIKRIYNWIDLEKFRPRDTDGIRKKLGLENKTVLLGISMLWIPQKGIEIFLKLAELLPDQYQIVLVGQCKCEKYCSDRIKFLGTIKDVDNLAELYAMADIFVNPTIQDTFGKTTAEAMACGTPVVAYNCTALPELLSTDGSCGELVDEYDAEAFCKGIEAVWAKICEGYNFNCRQRAEELFDKDKNIAEYVSLFEQISEC